MSMASFGERQCIFFLVAVILLQYSLLRRSLYQTAVWDGQYTTLQHHILNASKVYTTRKATSAPSVHETHLLFEDRLEALLPKQEFLSVEDVAAVEAAILQFSIPRPITLHWPSTELPLDYRYPAPVEQQCSNCKVVTSNDTSIPVQQIDAYLQGHQFRRDHTRVTICGCGEAPSGTGRRCFGESARCTYQNSFVRTDPLWSSYSRLQFPPDHLGVNTVAKLMARILTPWPHNSSETESATLVAMHSNCQGGSGRGQILSALHKADARRIISNGPRVFDSYGKCWHTRSLDNLMDPSDPRDWHWHDSEGNRDTVKTVVAARYRVTAALENTIDVDYFTEKRFQALAAGSVPLIFRKPAPHSEQYLPHPDAAVFADDYATPAALYEYLQQLASNDTLYYERHQAWKQRDGMAREFVKILFHGFNFLPCRACELLAHAKTH